MGPGAPHLKLAAIEEYFPSIPTRIPSALFPMGMTEFWGSLWTGFISRALWILSPLVPLPLQQGPFLGSGSHKSKGRGSLWQGPCQHPIQAPSLDSHTFVPTPQWQPQVPAQD